MKNKIVIAVLAITLFSCTKQASDNLRTETMTALELKNRYGITLPGLVYSEVTRGGKKASAQTVVVWLNDLVLSGSVECTVSENAQWGAIQKFLSEPLSMDGAVSYCNFYMPEEMNCPTTSSGVYRGWTIDFDYNVHISNLVTIP